jgi:hypothetical protein
MRTRMYGGVTGNAGDRLPMSIPSGRAESHSRLRRTWVVGQLEFS